MTDDQRKFQEILQENIGAFENTTNPWIGMNVVFTQMLAAGFRESQASTIIGVWIAHAAGMNNGQT